MTDSYKEDSRPAQQWYWDDWFSAFDVRLCSLAARGLWIDMLGIMWKAEIRGTLTINGKQINGKHLAKIVGSSEDEIKALIRELEEQNVFSRLSDGTIICRRMFKESTRKNEISRIRSEAGKKGAEKRWDDKSIAKSDSKTMAKMAASSSSATSSSKNKSTSNEDGFEVFWEMYPRKVSRKDALDIWKRLTKKQREDIITAVPNYVREIEILQQGPRFIKHPTTFINKDKERWADYLPGVWMKPAIKKRPIEDMTPEEFDKYQEGL